MRPTKSYINYIKSERWKAKRQQAFKHYGRRCFACGKAPKVLHVHHLDYTHLGNEPMRDLMPLCVDCHKSVTKIYRSNRRRGLRRVTMEYVNTVRKLKKTK